MKYYNYILIILLMLIAGACNQGGNKDIPSDIVKNPVSAEGETELEEIAKIEFEETSHDFGTVIQGEKVIYNFKFKNAGKTELLIAKVEATCGCTAIKYPRHPIKPGEGDVITITFNSEGRLGIQNKSVRVITNTQPNVFALKLKAMVVRPEKM